MFSHYTETDRIYYFILLERIENTCEYKTYKGIYKYVIDIFFLNELYIICIIL